MFEVRTDRCSSVFDITPFLQDTRTHQKMVEERLARLVNTEENGYLNLRRVFQQLPMLQEEQQKQPDHLAAALVQRRGVYRVRIRRSPARRTRRLCKHEIGAKSANDELFHMQLTSKHFSLRIINPFGNLSGISSFRPNRAMVYLIASSLPL